MMIEVNDTKKYDYWYKIVCMIKLCAIKNEKTEKFF